MFQYYTYYTSNLLIMFLLSANLWAQPYLPGDDLVFVDTEIPRVDIEIDQLDFQAIWENIWSNTEYPATFTFTSMNGIEVEENVGFRLRGNTSRASEKKSFKVSFNSFESGRKFHGLEKLNLNGEHNDPSILRSKICWDLLYKMNLVAPRSNHIELYINGDYHGLYINVEHIDEEFVENRFGSHAGNLYKCLWPADLNYKGSNPDLYKEENNGRRTYNLKTNTEEDDYTDLANFIDVLNNASDEDLFCEIREIFNLEEYAKYMAVDIFIANWDGPLYNKNNFYLYNNPGTGKFEYIPFDLDNTLGVDFLGGNFAERSIYNWSGSSNYLPLYERLIAVPEFKDWMSFYFSIMLDEIVSEDSYFNEISNRANMISPFVEADEFYPLDYGFSHDDFLNCISSDIDWWHVTNSIEDHLTERAFYANEQLEVNDVVPVVKYDFHSLGFFGEPIQFCAQVEDEELETVNLIYKLDGGGTMEMTMSDDGLNGDGLENDGYFCCVLNEMQFTEIDYQIEAIDVNGNGTLSSCDFKNLQVMDRPVALYINELMASNNSTIADESGAFEDWIELYNASESSIDLGGYHLSNKIDNPLKWELPDVNLEPGAFLLIWADDDEQDGALHTNFKLNAQRGTVLLSHENGDLIDRVDYRNLLNNQSIGYFPDANSVATNLSPPSPMSSNLSSNWLVGGQSLEAWAINVFPNPSKGIINLQLDNSNKTEIYFTIMDVNSKLIKAGSFNSNSLRINALVDSPAGIYFLELMVEGETQVFKLINTK